MGSHWVDRMGWEYTCCWLNEAGGEGVGERVGKAGKSLEGIVGNSVGNSGAIGSIDEQEVEMLGFA